jgi:hypothetical protein
MYNTLFISGLLYMYSTTLWAYLCSYIFVARVSASVADSLFRIEEVSTIEQERGGGPLATIHQEREGGLGVSKRLSCLLYQMINGAGHDPCDNGLDQ